MLEGTPLSVVLGWKVEIKEDELKGNQIKDRKNEKKKWMPYRKNREDKSNRETKLQNLKLTRMQKHNKVTDDSKDRTSHVNPTEVSCHGRDKFSQHTRDIHIHCNNSPGEHEWIPASEEIHSLTRATEETTLATDNQRNLGSEWREAGEGKRLDDSVH